MKRGKGVSLWSDCVSIAKQNGHNSGAYALSSLRLSLFLPSVWISIRTNILIERLRVSEL